MKKNPETLIYVRNNWEIARSEENTVTGKLQWERRDGSYICDVGTETATEPLPVILAKQTSRDQQVTAIAEAFAEVMRQWLSEDEFAAMKLLNETDPTYAGSTCCASHNYCDANMAMLEAFNGVTGHEISAESEDDCGLANDAWRLARKLYLGDQS